MTNEYFLSLIIEVFIRKTIKIIGEKSFSTYISVSIMYCKLLINVKKERKKERKKDTSRHKVARTLQR